jgi:hypothetical protein
MGLIGWIPIFLAGLLTTGFETASPARAIILLVGGTSGIFIAWKNRGENLGNWVPPIIVGVMVIIYSITLLLGIRL